MLSSVAMAIQPMHKFYFISFFRGCSFIEVWKKTQEKSVVNYYILFLRGPQGM